MSDFYSLGAKAVATCATISLASTITLGTFITYLFFRYRKIETIDTPGSTGIRFLRTPAGFIFLNLLVADSTQALGFGLTWVWASHGGINKDAHLCLFQALAIQAGDVASAVFSFLIAVYTAVLLTVSKKPGSAVLYIGATSSWIFVALLTFLGPIAIVTKEGGPFYSEAGNWCWISSSYAAYRLWFHYLLLFISAAGQLASYIAIFLVIRFRWVPQQKELSDMEREQGGLAMDEYAKTAENPISRPATSHTMTRASPDAHQKSGSSARMLDRTSLVMLLYPLINLTVIMPLSVYRVMALGGQPGSVQALAACGCIFSLGGLANVILYTFSRHLLSIHPKGPEQNSRDHSKSLFRKPSKYALYGTTKVTLPMDELPVIVRNHSQDIKIDLDRSRSSLSLDSDKCPQESVASIVRSQDTSGTGHVTFGRRLSQQLVSPTMAGITISHEVLTRSEA